MALQRLGEDDLPRATFRQLARILITRAWLAFSVLAIVGFTVFLFIDRDDPLRSDDPYLVGFIFGMVAAGLAAVYTAIEIFAQRLNLRHLSGFTYSVVLAGWCALMWALSRRGGEGAELFVYFAVASLGIGLLTYPLCRFRIPRTFAVIISGMGGLIVIMYCFVSLRMGTW